MIVLSKFRNNAGNYDGNVEFEDLKALGEMLQVHDQSDNKFEHGITRAKTENGGREAGDFIEGSVTLWLDIDDSKSGPEEFHKALTDLGLNHIVYTTFNHRVKGKNKIRCVIGCQEYFREDGHWEIKQQNKEICELLEGYGLEFKLDSVSNTFTQLMYYRNMKNTEVWEYYEDYDGKDWELRPYDKVEMSETSAGGNGTLDEMHENIRLGLTYHGAMRTLSLQWFKDGMSKANCKALLRTLMNSSEGKGLGEWQTRYNDIDRLVDGVSEEIECESEKLIKVEPEKMGSNNIPRAPGMLGELEQACYDSMNYQYREVSIISTLSLLGGICGRKFNMLSPERSGLNLYSILVADTGVGKNSMKKFASRILRDVLAPAGEEAASYASFLGPGNFTSNKAIHNAFAPARSRWCIFTELGLLLQQACGDAEGKQHAILDMFSTGGKYDYTAEVEYSGKDDSLPPLRAVAPTISGESTWANLKKAFDSMRAMESGFLPRHIIFRIPKRQPIPNPDLRDISELMSNNMVDRLKELAKLASTVQSTPDPDALDMQFDDSIKADARAYQIAYNIKSEEMKGVCQVSQHMATRIFEIGVRVAALATLINKSQEDPKWLLVEKREWDWTKDFMDGYFNALSTALNGMGEGSPLDEGIIVVYNKMQSIFDDTIGNSKFRINVKHREARIVPYSILKRATERNGAVNGLSDKYGKFKSGFEKIMDDMIREKAVKILDKDPIGLSKAPKLVQVTYAMDDYISSRRG